MEPVTHTNDLHCCCLLSRGFKQEPFLLEPTGNQTSLAAAQLALGPCSHPEKEPSGCFCLEELWLDTEFYGSPFSAPDWPPSVQTWAESELSLS